MSIERWDIDSSRSEIHFAVRHLVLSKTRGRFARWGGTVIVPDRNFGRATVDVVIDASSIDTGVERRDEHLRGPKYFDVRRHPEITFGSFRVTTERDGRLAVVGTLTIKGVTRIVTLAVMPNGHWLGSPGDDRAGFSARAVIDRRDFGFTGNMALDSAGVVIGEQIDVEVEIEAVRRPAVRAA